MNVTQPFPNLFLIDLEQRMTGFRRFISSWLYCGDGYTFLVDPGPLNSIDKLIEALQKLEVSQIDVILLTHIHIDHAGGTGRLLEIYPDAAVICHPRGIEHMIDPEKLWQGSLKVLGEIAEGYGEILPIPADRIRYEEEITIGGRRIGVTETPGHAVHHLSFSFGEYLFAGEVAGVHHRLGETVYARPATPPRFKLEISLASIDRVIALNPGIICFGHYGYSSDPGPFLQQARRQLLLWTDTVREELQKDREGLDERVIASLKQTDPAFANLDVIDPDLRVREEDFVKNSIRGIQGYVENE